MAKLAIRSLVEEALRVESRDVLARERYEPGASPGQGWRNNVPMGRLHTAEAIVDYAAPQFAGREEAFRSEFRESLKGNNQALEGLAAVLLAQGLSVRKEAGIEHVRLHDLRHTCATRSLFEEISSASRRNVPLLSRCYSFVFSIISKLGQPRLILSCQFA